MVKSGKKMSPMEAKGKLASLQELMKDMDSMMMDGMKGKKGMAKVSVMSDSPEGLKKGLEKAEDVLEDESDEGTEVTLPKFGSKQKSGALMEEEEFEEDSQDDSEDESDDSSEEELDRKIAELMAKKKSKKSKQI
jgi:hypothetical protein